MAAAEQAQEEEQAQDGASEASSEQELLTLSEVSKRTGISMPTLQRYKKKYQDRLPTVGKGRTQKYPTEALPVFQQIKKENIKKRGRPRKKSSEKKKTDKAPSARKDLLTLTEIGNRTGISYPTLVRYVKLHLDRIPHEGEGRRRRFYPEAVEVFKKIRGESRRGRRKKSSTGSGGDKTAAAGGAASKDLARRVKALERAHDRLEKQIRNLIKDLKKPLTVTVQRKG